MNSHNISGRRSHKTLLITVLVLVLLVSLVLIYYGVTSKSDSRPDLDVYAQLGYLSKDEIQDTAPLIGVPPNDGSDAQKFDLAVQKHMSSLVGTDRWVQASIDANDAFKPQNGQRPAGCQNFACQLDITISPEDTPNLYRLVAKATFDVWNTGSAVKNRYNRLRPFARPDLINGTNEVCTPHEKSRLMTNGSFPSGHASQGWMVAMVLSQASPEDTEKLMLRAHQFGDSRLICNMHWYSDIPVGREIAASVFAQLQSRQDFRDDLNSARIEIANAKKQARAVKKDWMAMYDAAVEYSKNHPDDEQAKSTLAKLAPLKEWSCPKELEVLNSFKPDAYLGR